MVWGFLTNCTRFFTFLLPRTDGPNGRSLQRQAAVILPRHAGSCAPCHLARPAHPGRASQPRVCDRGEAALATKAQLQPSPSKLLRSTVSACSSRAGQQLQHPSPWQLLAPRPRARAQSAVHAGDAESLATCTAVTEVQELEALIITPAAAVHRLHKAVATHGAAHPCGWVWRSTHVAATDSEAAARRSATSQRPPSAAGPHPRCIQYPPDCGHALR